MARRVVVVLMGLASVAIAVAAEEPTSDDFALRILPEEIVVNAEPGELAAVDLEVTVSSTVAGVQGWSYGLLAENNGLTTFYIENAYEHPDLATVAGEALTGDSIVPGRPSFDVINFYREGHLTEFDRENGYSINPTVREPNPPHDSAAGIPGTWAAVIQACVLDMACELTIPAVENFGAMALRVRAQGEAPNSGRLVFSDKIHTPPCAIVIVWNGRGFDRRKEEDVYIPPAIQAPSTITFGSARAGFVRGDANGDGEITIADAISSLSYLMLGTQVPSCLDTIDVNDDGELTIADPISLLSYLFANGTPPAPPFDACGVDPTGDGINCAVFAPCAGAP